VAPLGIVNGTPVGNRCTNQLPTYKMATCHCNKLGPTGATFFCKSLLWDNKSC